MEELNKVIGLPWQLRPKPIEGGGAMSPSSPEKDVMIELESRGDEAAATPLVERKRKGYVPRGLYIRRDVELQQFGYIRKVATVARQPDMGWRIGSAAELASRGLLKSWRRVTKVRNAWRK